MSDADISPLFDISGAKVSININKFLTLLKFLGLHSETAKQFFSESFDRQWK